MYEELMEKYKANMMQLAEDAFDELVASRMPYLEDDKIHNVEWRTGDVVKKLISGDYELDGGFLTVKQDGFIIPIRVTSFEWDQFRIGLIKLMPECPKDKEIEMLRNRIGELVKGGY